MPWESDQEEQLKVGRDWAKILWIVVGLTVAAGIAIPFIPSGESSAQTRARVRHILVPIGAGGQADVEAAYNTISDLRQRVLDGESFSALAKEYSSDAASAGKGGDLGWVHRGDLADAIDEFIWTAKVGEVSPVILTGFGLHLVMVDELHIADAELYERRLKERVFKDDEAPPSSP